MPTIYNRATGASRAVTDSQYRLLMANEPGKWSTTKPPTQAPKTGTKTSSQSGMLTRAEQYERELALGQAPNQQPLFASPGYDNIVVRDIRTSAGLSPDPRIKRKDSSDPSLSANNIPQTRYFVEGLSGQEQRIFNQFKNNMLDNPQRWWGVDTEAGMIYATKIGEGNIENSFDYDNAPKGVRYDKIIGALQSWYKNDAINELAIDDNLLDLGGGGGGGGGMGPVYVAPDRRVVEDQAKALQVSLNGNPTAARTKAMADRYMADHRRSWEIGQSGGEIIDPNQSMLEMARNYEDTKRIHRLRGNQEDEMTWISQRNQALLQQGLESQDASDRAVVLAQLGTSLANVDAGSYLLTKGQTSTGMDRRIANAATQVARAL